MHLTQSIPSCFYSVILLTWSFMISTPAQAQIYKWTDAQGKVHYSDKKVAESAQAQDLDLGTMPGVKKVQELTAKPYHSTRPALYLLREEMSFTQLTALRNPTKFAYLYYGGDCVSPTAVSYTEYVKRFNKSLPDTDDMFRDTGKLFQKYNYRTLSAQSAITNPKGVLDEEGNPPLKLRIDVVDMRINACTQRINKSTISGNLDKISINFDKANVWLQLRITVSDFSDDVVLLNTLTEGASDQVDGYSGNVFQLTTAAYEQAITNLIANDKFPELLTPRSKVQTINIAQPQSEQPQAEGGSLLSRIAEKMQFNAVKKSKLAEALSIVSPVRYSIVQYYAEQGKWPASFAEVNLNSAELQQQGIIDSAELRLGGVLHIRLAKTTFGENEILQLIPKPTQGGQNIDWECRTSLDKAFWVGECAAQ